MPPAYSPSRNTVIVATKPDLYVHAINNANGTQRWRVRPVYSSCNFDDPTEFRYGWPMVAENAGYVLVKARLPWDTLWIDWPQTNTGMRQLLTTNPCHRALFALNLDNGNVPFISNVGHGGYGDGGYMPMGPQSVVKRLPNGKDVVYVIRAQNPPYDSRWDSHFGEMMLGSTTVPGLQGGDVRFIRYDYPPGSINDSQYPPYLLTDEQPNVSMAGDYLYNSACPFSASHYCASSLEGGRPYDFGFYIYYNQGAVYDTYWSEYAEWVVSNNNVYFRSCDGAIIALTSGNPQGAGGASAPLDDTQHAAHNLQRATGSPQPVATISHTEARAWAGQAVTVTGTLRYVFNNGKQVLLGFSHPHQGSFKVLIHQANWKNFDTVLEKWYRVGQTIQVTGKIEWYQGDPTIYVTGPQQIVVQRERENEP